MASSSLLLLLLHLDTVVLANTGHSFTYFGPNFGTPNWSPAPVTAAPRADFASPTWSAFSVNPFSNAVTSNPWKPLPAISFVPDSQKPDVKPEASAEYPSYTQGPVNSAIPWTGYTTTTPSTTKATTVRTTTTTTEYEYQFTELEEGLPKESSDFYEQDLKVIDLTKGEQDQIVQKKNLQEFWNSYNAKNDDKTEELSEADLAYNRIARKISFSSPNSKNITGLIKKALSLVKKVEEIDKRKKSLETTISDKKSSKSTGETKTRNLEEERLRDLKEEQRFSDLKAFIKDQSSISSLIKSETAEIRDLFQSRTRDPVSNEGGSEKKSTREMIKALSKLNSISSLLLRDNESTKNRVRELPSEIRGIVKTEVDELKDLLEDQNAAVSGALRSALRNEELRDGRGDSQSETDIIILKALAKLNKISGVLLKEQEKTERQTNSALKALPALAKFIQAETSDIKDLLVEQVGNDGEEKELEDLRGAVAQSLANDKLITRAIIKLNDITQLLLRDVNFTTVAVTNKLPQAITALITSETGKIRKMIDVQNDAIVDILEESDNLARAERVIQEAQKIKHSIASGESSAALTIAKEAPEEDKLLAVLRPLLSKDSKLTKSSDPEEDRTLKLIEILEPILKKEIEEEEKEEEEVETEEREQSSALLETQLAGQKSIVKALLKLTNITRTLLDDKQQEQLRERPRSSDFDEKRPNRIRDDYDDGSIEEYEDYEEEYAYEDEYVLPLRKKGGKSSLVERVATSSAGSRALRGNQALFEEFVKLAIERQRWDQAQDVTRIIQDSLTTTRRPKKRRKEEEYKDYEEEYEEEYEYEEEKEELRERPRSQRPNKPLRQRPTSSSEREERRGNRKNLRKQEEDIYEDEEYDLDVKRPSRPKFRPTSKATSRPRPKRPTRPTRRPKPTTEAPADYEEEYLDYDEYELELEEENLADELVEGLVEGIEEELAEELEEEEDQVAKVKLFPARGSNLRVSLNSRGEPSSRSEGRTVASAPRLPPRFAESEILHRAESEPQLNIKHRRFGRPRSPSVTSPPPQRSVGSAPGKQADFTVTGKAAENRGRPTSTALPQPDDSAEKPGRQQAVASINSRPKKPPVFSEQNAKSKDLLHQLLNSGKSKKQEDSKLSQFEVTEAVPSSSSRADPRRLFGGGRRRKKKLFPRPPLASREQPQQKSPDEQKSKETVEDERQSAPSRPQPSPAPVVKETTEKQNEPLRLGNANEIRRPQLEEKEVEKSTKSSVSFSVSASKSKSSLSDSSKEMLEAALNNLHKIAGDKKKEKESSQSAEQAAKEAKVDSEVKDLRGGAASRPRFLNPSLGEQKTETPRPARPQQPQSSARPQGSGRPSRPAGFGRPSSPSRPQNPSRPSRPQSSGRSSTRGEIEEESEEVATTARSVSIRTKRPRPLFNRGGRPPTRPSSSGPKSERLEIQSASSERPIRTERPKRPQRPRPVFTPKRPESKPQPAVLPPIQLKSKDPSSNTDEQQANVEPLTEEEKARKTSERNNLLNLLSKNRKTGRSGGSRSSSRPQPPTASQLQPQSENKKEMSPLESLFQIITSSSSSSSSSSTSSSSSSSSPSSLSQKGVRVTSHGRKQGKKKKGSKRPPAPSPTEDPELRGLSPQERLVKKVQETLVVQDGPSLQARDRPRGVRKKVILRKEKPREGRRLGTEGSKIKTRKIRVRRPEEEPPLFPIVY